jgi:hypothetical protein
LNHLHFLAPELAKWDAAAGSPTLPEALVLSFFQDERPLRGAAGLTDWRLCGRLSRLLRSGKLLGGQGEVTLVPPAGSRLPFPRIFLFGLGDSARFDEAVYRLEVRRIRKTLARAGVRRFALQPPGRAMGLISARRALELLLEESRAESRSEGNPEAEVTVIESPGGQKEMAEAMRAKKK